MAPLKSKFQTISPSKASEPEYSGQLQVISALLIVLSGEATPTTDVNGDDTAMEQSTTKIGDIYLPMEAADLRIGDHYKLCLDRDGYGGLYGWGESGYSIFLRPFT